MELLWLVLSLLVVDLAALLFAVDSRPGFQHSSRPSLHRPPGPAVVHVPRWPNRPVHGWPNRHSNKG
jgi:hypothetical protein